jgi:hypothetical protein
MTALVLCSNLAGSDITVMPAVRIYGIFTLVIYSHMADVVPPSTALVFVTKIGEKHQYILHSAIQVKNRLKAVSNEKKLNIITQLQKGDRTVDICCNVRLHLASVGTVHDNAKRIAESAKSGAKASM